MKKILASFVTVGVMAASAAVGTYKVSLFQDSIVDGKQIKAGDYKLELQNNMAILKHGKQTVEVPAREETAPSKFAVTEIQYTNNNDLQEIRIGGTNTRIVFTGENATVGGGQ